MQTIVPAIIPTSYEHLFGEVGRFMSFAPEVQVDIVDGKFVPPVSWPYGEGESAQDMRNITILVSVEMDLMVESPETVIPMYADAGVEAVVVHLETVTDMRAIQEMRDTFGFKLGLSIGNGTPLDLLRENIECADYVQLMGIPEIGSQGKPFDERVLERIETIRALHPDILISIDGSVNKETLPRLKAAGANRFVAGSAIANAPEPRLAFETLSHLAL